MNVADSESLVSVPRLKSYYENAIAPFEASPDSSAACVRDTETFQKALGNLELWAVKMYDATGKPQSGLLHGNTNHMGDYVECVDAVTSSDTEAFASQYCLASLYVEQANDDSSVRSERFREVLDRVNSYEAIKSSYEDVPGFFPSFTPILWGVCVPSSCSESDVHRSLARRISRLNSSAGNELAIKVKIEKGACEVKQYFELHPGAILALIFMSSVGLLAIAGTIYDMNRKNGSKEVPGKLSTKILLAFSIRHNCKVLFHMDANPSEDDITCVHGLRALFSLFIYGMHKSLFGLFFAYTNRTYIAELLQSEWTMFFRSFYNAVDAFVLLSGLLTSYFAVSKLQQGKKLNIPRMYLQRYFKFTPSLLILILIVGQLSNYVVVGPQAIRVAYHFIWNCRDFSSIVKSLLYISNFEGVNKMCYPPSHQLITDMQMYLTAPFLILLLWKWPKRAPMAVLVIISLLAFCKYAAIYLWNTNTVIFYGSTIEEINVGADVLYLQPLHRLTPYVVGVSLGFLLRTAGKENKLSKTQLAVGWCVAFYAAYFSFFHSKGASKRDYVAGPEVPFYGSLQPITWSFALSWIIYTCHTGRADLLNRALSWKGFVFFTRLAFSVYMVQIYIMFRSIGRQLAPEHFSLTKMIDLNELAVIGFFSIVLNLLFLMPLIDLWKIMTTSQKGTSSTNGSTIGIKEKEIMLGTSSYHTKEIMISSLSGQGRRRAKNTDDLSSRNT